MDKKKCYHAEAHEFWKEERKKERAEKEASKKRPMEDSEALSEKKLQEIPKEEVKRRKEHFDAHLERFRYTPGQKTKDEPEKPEASLQGKAKRSHQREHQLS